MDISGEATVLDITAGTSGGSDTYYGIYAINNRVSITDAEVHLEKLGENGAGVWAEGDIRILGDAQMRVIDWSSTPPRGGLHSEEGNIAIGSNALADIVAQQKGIYASQNVYIGYVFSSWNVYRTGAPGTIVTVSSGDTLVMPAYPVTISSPPIRA